jgi:protein O-GlcNAc transferase
MTNRLSRRHFCAAFGLVLVVFFALESLVSPRADVRFLRFKEARWTGYAGPARLTSVLAHQPGFTVFENLYWQNDTFYVVTDQPWTIPDLDHIAIRPTPKHDGVPTADKAVKILAIREPGINAFVREENQLGRSILLEDAVELTASAQDLPSPLLMNYDDMFVSHYYHWIGETFLGAWRIWSHYRYRSGAVLDDFKVVSFRNMYDLDDTPEHLNYDSQWEDHAGANRFFMEKWFPGIEIESRAIWDARAASNTLYRMPIVVLANRWAGHRGPSAAWKPWGDVLRMPVHPGYLLNLRQRVLKGYRGSVNLRPSPRPRVKYLTRQETNRRLTDAAHDALVAELIKLDDEGIVEFSLLHFVDGDSFEDQVAHMASTDFLIGVHGNGLTHSLWMTPGPCKGVFELQPKPCSLNDFSPLALAAGVTHYLVTEDSMCTPLECADRGCGNDVRGPNRDNIVVDPVIISHQIRRIVERHWRNGVEVE